MLMEIDANGLQDARNRHVSLRGVARNAKAGAVLMMDQETVIYIQGKREWPPEIIGKRVRVDGVLRRDQVYPDVKEENGATSQGLPGEQWYVEVEGNQRAD